MKKFFISKPFLFAVILFCVISLFSFSKCFAASDDCYSFTGFDDKSYSVPNLPEKVKNYKYYILVSADSGGFRLYCFNDSLKVIKLSNGQAYELDSMEYELPYFNCSTNNPDTWVEGVVSKGLKPSASSPGQIVYSSSNLFANKDTINDDGFFFPHPAEIQGTLAPIVEETPLEGVLQEIVEILPLILVVVVSFLGLRKALKMLSMLLHQA